MEKKFENKTIVVDLFGTKYNVKLVSENYSNGGRLAIEGICDDGEPFSTLTVNIGNANLKENEVCIKNWSENEQFADAAKKSGYFKDTGKRIQTGFVEAEIWEVL